MAAALAFAWTPIVTRPCGSAMNRGVSINRLRTLSLRQLACRVLDSNQVIHMPIRHMPIRIPRHKARIGARIAILFGAESVTFVHPFEEPSMRCVRWRIEDFIPIGHLEIRRLQREIE
jgi:hypothetical protein